MGGLLGFFANRLNYKLMSLPFTYLGLPVVANPRRKETWDLVVRKIKKRLARWKH